MKLPITEIYVDHDFNCRTTITKDSVFNLAMSIMAEGLMNQISVYRMPDGRYRVLAGNRRFTAIYEWLYLPGTKPEATPEQRALSAVWSEVEVNIRENMSEEAQIFYNLGENFNRLDLTIEEEAFALEPLFKRGLMATDIALKINRSPTWVYSRKYFLELPKFAQDAVIELKLSQTDIKDLRDMSEDQMRVALDTIREADMKGNKVPSIKEATKDRKRVSQTITHQTKTRQEILQTQEYLTHLAHEFFKEPEQHTARFMLNFMSWAAGEISDAEFFIQMVKWTVNEGLRNPHELRWLEKIQTKLTNLDEGV